MGKLLASGDQGDTIQLRDTATLELRATFLGHRSDVIALSFAPDGQRLASSDASGAVRLWDVPTAEQLLELLEPDGRIGAVHFLQFAPDGRTLVGASPDHGGHFVIWHGNWSRSGTSNGALNGETPR
jgi:WD40 repeat protein